MNRAQYLANSVAAFRDWLAQRLCGQPISFAVPGAVAYPDLPSALATYRWPRRARNGLPNPHLSLPHVHPVVPRLAAHSSLATNEAVLQTIQHQMRTAYAAGPNSANQLSGAVAAVLYWGGVYTKRGNLGWLSANQANLLVILQAVVNDHARGSDTSAVTNLRFNSGMTKVYSLLIDGFIIYDSRVAAALAWLAKRWWTIDCGQPALTLPSLLRFACLPANGAMARYRNPDLALFPSLAVNPYEHYTWNVRTNWLLADSLRVAGNSSLFGSLREVEAALFQMGDRVI
ncbi:hypothetical protein HCU66_07400 [Pseudomonas frederiksbergensis]|uniref:hypothetical protein n=1 Tax=Pseudomonas frederiksbergensis TaxID=104087 RepID=UPI001980D39F|nr:hypothetical protein [Pseudomonas frederiksbergensis]MBN3862053.1 hypothetical protein [Pseudomonas frederiksbergensis]